MNSFKTFWSDTKDPKRFQILNNFKEINRIITKNYIKNNDDGMSILDSDESKSDDFKSSNKTSNYTSKAQSVLWFSLYLEES